MPIRPVLLAPLLLLLAAPPAHGQGRFRLVQWNVSDSAWVRHADATRAVLRHIDADVIVLDEVNEFLGEPAVRDMLRGLRGPADTTWFVSVGAGGGFQRTAIASRDSVRPLEELARIVRPSEGPLALAAAMPDTVQGRARRDDASTIAANGARVRVRGRWLMVVGMDLTCCGGPGSWRDARRRLEAATIAERARTAAARTAPDGIVTVGDMNLVTGRATLDLLLTLTPDQVIARAVHPDGWTTWTWDGRGTPFNGGQLDVTTYSGASLRQLAGRVWNTEMMPADTLAAHGLEPGTSASINRHRPVVIDLEWVR